MNFRGNLLGELGLILWAELVKDSPVMDLPPVETESEFSDDFTLVVDEVQLRIDLPEFDRYIRQLISHILYQIRS